MTDQHFDHDPLAALVREAAPARFDDGFSERVLERLHRVRAGTAARETPMVAALERQFLRVVPLAAAATLMLAAYNWWGSRDSAGSALDAALNLPQVTLSSAFAPTALYGVASIAPENP